MEVTYLWPPWLSGSYHPRFELAFSGGMSADGALPPDAGLAAAGLPLYDARYYEGQFSTQQGATDRGFRGFT